MNILPNFENQLYNFIKWAEIDEEIDVGLDERERNLEKQKQKYNTEKLEVGPEYVINKNIDPIVLNDHRILNLITNKNDEKLLIDIYKSIIGSILYLKPVDRFPMAAWYGSINTMVVKDFGIKLLPSNQKLTNGDDILYPHITNREKIIELIVRKFRALENLEKSNKVPTSANYYLKYETDAPLDVQKLFYKYIPDLLNDLRFANLYEKWPQELKSYNDIEEILKITKALGSEFLLYILTNNNQPRYNNINFITKFGNILNKYINIAQKESIKNTLKNVRSQYYVPQIFYVVYYMLENNFDEATILKAFLFFEKDFHKMGDFIFVTQNDVEPSQIKKIINNSLSYIDFYFKLRSFFKPNMYENTTKIISRVRKNIKNFGLETFLKKDFIDTIDSGCAIFSNPEEYMVKILQELYNKFGANGAKKIFKDLVAAISLEDKRIRYDDIRPIRLIMNKYGTNSKPYFHRLFKMIDLLHDVSGPHRFSQNIIDNINFKNLDLNSNYVEQAVCGGLILLLEPVLDNIKQNVKIFEKKEIQELLDNLKAGKVTIKNGETGKKIQTLRAFKNIEPILEEAKKNPKISQIVSVHYNIDGFTFSVLPNMSLEHFTVGLDTNCCQRLGGAGEDAAIDSIINPQAGVLTLKDKNKQTVAQSYFHYVPNKNIYILDNIESNDGLVTKYNLNLSKMYAKLAKRLISDGANGVYAGKNYSSIDTKDFDTIKLNKDPRSFAVTNPYTDFDFGDAMDLSKPNFGYKDSDSLMNNNEQSGSKQKMLTYTLQDKAAIINFCLKYFIKN